MKVLTHISRKIFAMAAISALWLIMAFTCEVPEIEVEDREFILTKEWKAKEINRVGQDPTEIDISTFRLDLREDFTFHKIEFSDVNLPPSELTGTWNLLANQTQLELSSIVEVNDSTTINIIKRYSIISLKLREIQLDLTYDSEADPDDNKLDQCTVGGECTRLILEPVKQ